MAVNRNIKVVLNDEELAFLKWFAKRDGKTVAEEMQQLFYTQLMEDMDLYNKERLLEETKNPCYKQEVEQ